MTDNRNEAVADWNDAVDLGAPGDYPELPAPITLNGDPYFLTRDAEGTYRLLSAICPHAGGEIRKIEDVFICPMHYWIFSQSDGSCLSLPDERLMQRPVELRADGKLYAIGSDS